MDSKQKIRILEAENESLLSENKRLKKIIDSNNNTMSALSELQDEYVQICDELKVLKEKYRRSVNDSVMLKKKFEEQFNEICKEFQLQ